MGIIDLIDTNSIKGNKKFEYYLFDQMNNRFERFTVEKTEYSIWILHIRLMGIIDLKNTNSIKGNNRLECYTVD